MILIWKEVWLAYHSLNVEVASHNSKVEVVSPSTSAWWRQHPHVVAKVDVATTLPTCFVAFYENSYLHMYIYYVYTYIYVCKHISFSLCTYDTPELRLRRWGWHPIIVRYRLQPITLMHIHIYIYM